MKAKRIFINPLYKDKATVLKTSQETGGKYLLGELEIAPGGGNPMHVHNAFAETFTSLKGILGVRVENRKLYLKPGDSVTVPVNTPHCFFNDSHEVVVCHVKFEPGHDGFMQGLAIAYGLAADGKTNAKGIPTNITYLALIMDMTDTRPTGVVSIITPLLKWLAARAKKKGVDKALLKRYYYA